MTKKGNLSEALSNFDRRPTIVKTEEVKKRTDKKEVINSSIPPSRRGKKAITNYFSPEVVKQIKLLSIEEDKTSQLLMEEAVNELFKKYGKPHIA